MWRHAPVQAPFTAIAKPNEKKPGTIAGLLPCEVRDYGQSGRFGAAAVEPDTLPVAPEEPLAGGAEPAGRSAAPLEAPVVPPEAAAPVLAAVFMRACPEALSLQ